MLQLESQSHITLVTCIAGQFHFDLCLPVDLFFHTSDILLHSQMRVALI